MGHLAVERDDPSVPQFSCDLAQQGLRREVRLGIDHKT